MSGNGSDDGTLTTRQAGVGLLLVGLLVAGFGGYDYVQQDRAIADAVEVDATVLETGVDENHGTTRSDTSYTPEVRFRYAFRGETYTSTNVHATVASTTYDTEAAARDVADEYTVNETVTAYVDPSTPGEGFLESDRSNTPLYVVGAGVLFVLGGVRTFYRG